MSTLSRSFAPRGLPAPAPRRRSACARAVIPQLESLVIQHVCPMLDSCEGVYLGDERHQMQVFDSFLTLARTMDISHGTGYVLRALLAGDKDLAYDFAMSLDTYNLGLNLVHECLERLEGLGEIKSPPSA